MDIVFYNTFYGIDGRHLFSNMRQHLQMYSGRGNPTRYLDDMFETLEKDLPDVIACAEVETSQVDTYKHWADNHGYDCYETQGESIGWRESAAHLVVMIDSQAGFELHPREIVEGEETSGAGSGGIWLSREGQHIITIHLASKLRGYRNQQLLQIQLSRLRETIDNLPEDDQLCVLGDFNLSHESMDEELGLNHRQLTPQLRGETTRQVDAPRGSQTKSLDHILTRHCEPIDMGTERHLSDHRQIRINNVRKQTQS